MSFMLKPEMLRCPDCRSERISAAKGDMPGFSCTACGVFMEKRGPVLNALPKKLSMNTVVNLGHYEEMAKSDHSHLDNRGKTRNHRTKFDALTEFLGLGTAGERFSVFEMGTGAGTHGAEFARRGHHYVGLDISAKALYRAAAGNAPLAESLLIAGDATAIPLQDNLFDRVFCVAMLHHLPEPLDGLRELIRVLKPGGRYCLIEPRWFHPAQIRGWMRHPDVEVGTFKVMQRRIFRALAGCGVREKRVRSCVYTPNRPAWLVPAYDVVDTICGAFPPLHALSVVRCTYGVK